MIYLILYDISEDKRRTKVAKRLVKEGYERIQYSVFCGPANPRSNVQLWKYLEKLCDSKGEETCKLFVIPMSKKRFLSMEILGDLDIELEYLTGDLGTLII